jgi:hypothetical protein
MRKEPTSSKIYGIRRVQNTPSNTKLRNWFYNSNSKRLLIFCLNVFLRFPLAINIITLSYIWNETLNGNLFYALLFVMLGSYTPWNSVRVGLLPEDKSKVIRTRFHSYSTITTTNIISYTYTFVTIFYFQNN